MIHVLIVEDEPPTLRRIAGMVEKLNSAFLVIGTAMNGAEALDIMEKTHVDLLITDIRMPVMDGMQLMSRVRAQYPECMIAVLSGYQDFEYVSHAIRARSLDYLLKPVSTEDMRGLLNRVQEQYMSMSRERLKRSLATRLNKGEAGMRHGGEDDAALRLCLFCAGSFPHSDDAEMYPAANFWNGRSLEKLGEAITPGLMEFAWEFMGNTPVERILTFQTLLEPVEPWVKCLHEALLDGGGVPISCVYLREPISLDQTGDIFRRMRRALRDHMRIGRSLFMALSLDEPREEELDDGEDIKRLSKLLSSGRIGENDPEKRELFARIEREQWPQRRIIDLLLGAARQMERQDQEAVRELGREYQTVLPDIICTSLSLKELELNISSLTAFSPEPAQSNPAGQEAIVVSIERYLTAHYAEHITNQTLGATFGYVPSYISLLFRQKYGLSPSEYLTRIRLGEAKQLMREHPDMLIKEIAEAVGFKSQHHFSRTFKTKEGIWPTDYHL